MNTPKKEEPQPSVEEKGWEERFEEIANKYNPNDVYSSGFPHEIKDLIRWVERTTEERVLRDMRNDLQRAAELTEGAVRIIMDATVKFVEDWAESKNITLSS